MAAKSTLGRIALTTLLVIGMNACSRDPHATALPLNLADIPKIQPQLNKLPAEERDLVLAYLQRSKGDVLPPKFADPDEPFTARTFAEAIKLQREFKARQTVAETKYQAIRDSREAALEPLRQALAVTLVKREIRTADETYGSQSRLHGGRVAKSAINNKPVLVSTYRLHNTADESIVRFSGSVTVRTAADPDSLTGVTHCYFDSETSISTGMTLELPCASQNLAAGDAAQAFVDMPMESLIVTWEPKAITFGSGKKLKADD